MKRFDQYAPEAVVPYTFADPRLEADVLREVSDQRIGTAENGQQFSAIHANSLLVGAPTFVRINSPFGSTENADQQYIGSQYIAAFPDHRYLEMDLPGHGASDKLTKAQRKAINDTDGSLATVASAQVEAAINIVPDLKDVTLTGEAMGELLALEFATQAAIKGIRVQRFFGFDPLGMEERSPIALAASYLAVAQKSRRQRRKESDEAGEQRLEDAFSKVFVPKMKQLGPIHTATRVKHAGLMARERTILRLMFKKSPMTRDTGLRALEDALDSNPDMKAYFVFAGQSVVGRLTASVRSSLDDIRQANPGRVKYDEWPHDNQDIGLARHQPRLIKYIKDHS